MKTKIIFSFTAAFLVLTLLFSSKVSAENSRSLSETPEAVDARDTPRPGETVEPAETPEPQETPEPSETPRVKGFDRLEGRRLEFCTQHEDEVNTRLTSLGDLVANILGKFDAIAARVEQFYLNNVVPSGKTVPNYDALISDIASKRAAAVTALSDTQNDINGFSCTADNPKGQIRLFRTDMQSVKRALQDYRTSIKNLIVAVHTVVGGTETPEASETPKASETPEATATP